MFGVFQVPEVLDRYLKFKGRVMQNLGQFHEVRGDFRHPVKHHAAGGPINKVHHIVHVGNELVDLVAVNGGDKGFMEHFHGVMGDLVGVVLGVLQAPDLRRGVLEVFEHVQEDLGPFHASGRVLVKNVEKAEFLGN